MTIGGGFTPIDKRLSGVCVRQSVLLDKDLRADSNVVTKEVTNCVVWSTSDCGPNFRLIEAAG